MLSHIKISNSIERNSNVLAKARQLSILPTSLDIFDIRQHFIRILFFFSLLIIVSARVVWEKSQLLKTYTIQSTCERNSGKEWTGTLDAAIAETMFKMARGAIPSIKQSIDQITNQLVNQSIFNDLELNQSFIHSFN